MPIDFKAVPSPCFIMDEEKFRGNLALLKEVREKAGIKILVAFKGFAMWSVFPILKEYGFDEASSSSLWESRLGFEELGKPSHVFSPVFTEKEFPELLEYVDHISFNSLNQFHRFYSKIKASGKKVSPGLRVNPECSQVATAIYDACSPGSRLGEIAAALPEKLPEGLEGIHFHALCESGPEQLENLLLNFEQRFAAYLPQVKWLNMGGGHYITRSNYDIAKLLKLISGFKQRHPHLEIIIEPGTAFAYNTGFLVSTVHDVIDNHGIKTAMLDVSFTAHMPDVLEYPYKPEILGTVDETSGAHVYRMGGNSCLAGDFFGNWAFPSPLEIGQQVIFTDMMHYTIVKTTTFNGVMHPSIALWTRDQKLKIIREFNYSDFKNRLS